LLVVSACFLFLTVAGCGSDDGLGRRYSVSGTVKYKGEPLAKGQINFLPQDGKGRGASGLIEDGYYALSTNGDRDGALPGKYSVTILAKELDLTKAEARSKKLGTGIPLPSDVAKANRTAKNLVPVKYSSPDTSKLTAEVKEQSDSIPFELSD
jgi:hypothetical protein